jgi:hypothetical protein
MWVPGAISYSIALIVFLFQWLAEEDRRGELSGRVERGQAHGG